MTEETPIKQKQESNADPQYVAEDLADVRELLERAGNYHEAAGEDVIAAELRRGAAVVDQEVNE
jgi:hypothetical protein